MFIFYLACVVIPLGKNFDVGIANVLLKASAPLLFMTVYPIIFKAIENKSAKKPTEQ